MTAQAVTAARVDILTATNVTFADAFQFGTPGDTSWSFTGQSFRMDLKSNKFGPNAALLSITSGAGQIVVSDPVNRILYFDVPEATFSAADVIPGEYDYDFIMLDASNPAVRIALMYGKFKMVQGVTGG